MKTLQYGGNILHNYGKILGIFEKESYDFFKASGLNNMNQMIALDYLVAGLKVKGLWNKMKAIYPFIGGTAFTHKWNLKDPRDLDEAFRLTFYGGFTHSVTGVKGNGMDTYANTHFYYANFTDINSTHNALYYVQGTISGRWEFGNVTGSALPAEPKIRFTQVSAVVVYTVTGNTYSPNRTTDNGFFALNRTTNINTSLFYNNNKLYTNTNDTIYNIIIDKQMTLFTQFSSLERNGNISDSEHRFYSIGDGLTDLDASNLYQIVQQYQKLLNRAV